MAAYGAAISLKNTIQQILQSSRFSLVPPSPQVLQPAYDAMCRLQKVLLKLEETGYSKMRTKVNALDDRIKEVIWEFEDLLESYVYDQILPQLESARGQRDSLSFSVDVQSLRESVDGLVNRVMVMEAEYELELLNMPEEEGQPISSRIDYGGINSNMVGLSVEFEVFRDYLLKENEENCNSLTGMAGIGKTTFAKKIFDDPLIQSHFKVRAWVKVGRKCESSETLRCILAQVDPNTHHQMLIQADDGDVEKLAGLLEERLKDKKCFIVLDDVWKWDNQVMDNLPKENVRILLTSRQTIEESIGFRVRLLYADETKKLLGEKLFGEEGFPPHLDKLGEKIALKCEGLPLMIVTVAELLSKEDKTPQNWREVAQKRQNSVFLDAYNQISEVFFPSYDYLPQYLKMFFLYSGAFPPYIDIEIEDIFNQLSAEGFLEPIGKQTLEDSMVEYSVKLGCQFHLAVRESYENSRVLKQNFRVHSCWQHICKKEASKIKFLHVLQSCEDVIKDQRRLCAHSNSLFSFKEVYDSIKSECASTVRSLLCYGPFHKYPVPVHDMGFKLLRVLNAVDVRFYQFPHDILKLVCLKYLALTCSRELPLFISNLFHLQFLIIYPHMSITKRGALSYMPLEIWNMKELQHIHVLGRELPVPNHDATLEKLSYLCGVSAKSCTRDILKRICDLKQLVIMMEVKPYDDDDDNDPMSGLDNISKELKNLEALSYFVMNPELKYEYMVPLLMFPSSLTVLQLSGLGCPWKYMNEIASLLPNLVELILQHYAFRGRDWDMELGCYLKLEVLTIEDTDLMHWRAQHGSLPRLSMLTIRHCYKLHLLYWTPDPSMVTRPVIDLVDCSPLAIINADQISPELFDLRWHTSWTDE